MPRDWHLSDLVQDSKIETLVADGFTQHAFYTSGLSTRERLVRREERWVRDGSTAFLGQGAYGTVYRERCDKKLRAVKEINKCVTFGEVLDYERELEAVAKFSHPKYSHCFVRSDGWFETVESVYIVMEYLQHGDLQRYLIAPMREHETRKIISQVLEGLRHMHENGFVHRDLKPGNIMVVTPGPDWFVKITDFGISKRRQQGVTTLHTLGRGTIGFAAPEALGLGTDTTPSSYTFSVDMRSLGVVTYQILTAHLPFQDIAELFGYFIKRTEFPLVALESQRVTAGAREFILKLMSPQPDARLSSALAGNHAWLNMPYASYVTDTSDEEWVDALGVCLLRAIS